MKQVYIKCRPGDPERFSGIFEVMDDFYFAHSRGGGMNVEIRLNDNRIIECDLKNDKYIVYNTSLNRAKSHKVIGVDFMYNLPTLPEPPRDDIESKFNHKNVRYFKSWEY